PLRARIGENARCFALAEHNVASRAADYLTFLREVIDNRPRRKLMAEVSHELVGLGVGPTDDHFLRGVATDFATILPGKNFRLNASSSQSAKASNSRAISPNGNGSLNASSSPPTNGRMPKVEGFDFKRAAIEYPRKLDAERRHYLLTKPFYNLANKPPKHSADGMDAETFRHFCDFANIAVALGLPAGSRILDVGCGSGWLSEYFARLGYVVKGIDISAELIEMSRQRIAKVAFDVDHETPLRCTFEVHDIEQSALNEKFDAIVCYDSLHHFENEHAVMRHLAEMLPIGGLLFILEGDRPATGSPTEVELTGVMREFGTLESPFDYDYLRELLNQHGFAVVGDYVSVNGLFEREMLEDDRLPLATLPTNYYYLTCKKVAEGAPASIVPDSRRPGLLRARIALREPVRECLEPGQKLLLDLEIQNIGDTLWLASRHPRAGVVMPAVRVFDEAGTLVDEFHGQPALPRAVAPGETVRLKIEYAAPQRGGQYTLKLDLVDQHVCWFEEKGSEPLTVRFEVIL
ncbi:MAG TPA: methyltransferase domain-containing protein, partial [Pyrinomonadaceae bacterium]|nr:methyltransferase domain-containing protein [Pyrinomonadaceae bacterium]